ncbi:hypothetical protein M7I_0988 [Glarea lozoyensis 74030]|uniref:Uncharacterized protein n=1 Tax=Glarea lozoyensis (strain ATCC 74030 / MF5533) TaxID=1104152 RepID=H0EEV3_GLAL7|nr:hypothetical protein M7I_0988 [Glarea lozoyensis 74030]
MVLYVSEVERTSVGVVVVVGAWKVICWVAFRVRESLGDLQQASYSHSQISWAVAEVEIETGSVGAQEEDVELPRRADLQFLTAGVAPSHVLDATHVVLVIELQASALLSALVHVALSLSDALDDAFAAHLGLSVAVAVIFHALGRPVPFVPGPTVELRSAPVVLLWQLGKIVLSTTLQNQCEVVKRDELVAPDCLP